MDDDLFGKFMNGIPFQRQIVSGGSTNGRIRVTQPVTNNIENAVPDRTTNYADSFVQPVKGVIAAVKLFILLIIENYQIIKLSKSIFFPAFRKCLTNIGRPTRGQRYL